MENKIELLTSNINTLQREIEEKSSLLAILGQTWLMDDTITKYFDFLSLNLYRGNLIFLMNPVIVEAVKVLSDVNAIIDPLCLDEKELLVIPVNNATYNNNDEDSYKIASGTHWSLLIYEKKTTTFLYYDSLQLDSSNQVAKVVSEKLSKYFKLSKAAEFISIQGPKQTNSFDCGVYMLHAVEYFCQHFSKTNFVPNMVPDLSEINCVKKRCFIAYILNNRFSTTGDALLSLVDQSMEENKSLDSSLGAGGESCFGGDHHKQVDVSVQTDIVKPFSEVRATFGSYDKDTIKQNINKSITVLGDSHGRNLSKLLQESCGEGVHIRSIVRPGACIDSIMDVAQDIEKSKDNCIIVIAGANNLYNGQVDSLCRKYRALVDSLKPCNIIVASVPFRHDLSLHDQINENIMNFNLFVHEMSHLMKGVTFLDLTGFPRGCFQKSGVHFNLNGKKLITGKILQKILPLLHRSSRDNNQINSKPKHHTETTDLSNPVVSGSASISNPFQAPLERGNMKLRLLQADMKDMIETFRRDSGTAFSHCISADFEDERSLSAGVAKLFKKYFGRPKVTDKVNEYLVCQGNSNEAKTYGLITKPIYSSKPSLGQYDTSFHHLIADFKNKGLKRLVCSPMGCVRDQLAPDILIKNLINFQKATNAEVILVVFDERSHNNKLRRGLSHQEFMKKLQDLILSATDASPSGDQASVNHEYLTCTPPPSDVSLESESSPWAGWSSPSVLQRRHIPRLTDSPCGHMNIDNVSDSAVFLMQRTGDGGLVNSVVSSCTQNVRSLETDMCIHDSLSSQARPPLQGTSSTVNLNQ